MTNLSKFRSKFQRPFLGLILFSLIIEIGLADDRTVAPGIFENLEPLMSESAALPESGQPMLLQFWASWCHSCSGIMWDMDELMTSGQGIAYLAISLDEAPEDARRYIKKHALFSKYETRYFYDPDKLFADRMEVETVPAIVLLDGEGREVVRKAGHLNSSDLQDLNLAMKQLRSSDAKSQDLAVSLTTSEGSGTMGR